MARNSSKAKKPADPNEKVAYVVTDVAGFRPDIAGKRRRAGETVHLNAIESQFEISRGTIVLADEASA